MASQVRYISVKRHSYNDSKRRLDSALGKIVLPATFICVNLVAFVVRADLAAMMMVPNILVLFQMNLVSRLTAISLVALPISLSVLNNAETVYILAIHCLFYMAFLMVALEIETPEDSDPREENRRPR